MKLLFLIFPVLFCLSSFPAWTQETGSVEPRSRATAIEQERRKKGEALKADKPGKVEQGFRTAQHYGDLILAAPPAGIRPKFSSSAPGWGSLVLGSGFSFGPEYYRPDLAKGEIVFRCSAIGTLRRNYLFDTQLTFPRAVKNRMVFDLLGRYKAERSIDYYGPGPDSQRGSRTNYSRESSELNFRYDWKPVVRSLQVGVTGGLLLVNVGPGISNRVASTEQVFGSSLAPGVQEQTNFLKGGPFLDFDSRDIPNLPRKGTRVRVSYDYYQDRKRDAYSFRLLQALVEHFCAVLQRGGSWPCALRRPSPM